MDTICHDATPFLSQISIDRIASELRDYGHDMSNQSWTDSFDQAVAYANAHGTLPSANDPNPEVRRLGEWVRRARGTSHIKQANRWNMLNDIEGWSWPKEIGD
jgi:hypothetical protein